MKNPFKKEKIPETVKASLNHDFISMIAPLGGISFGAEDYVKTGNGYEMCVLVYDYPTGVQPNWLSVFTEHTNTICVTDIAATNTNVIKANLRKSLEEQSSRAMSAKSSGDLLDAQRQFAELETMYQEVNSFGTVMKAVINRIYIPAKTLFEVDTIKKEIIASLEGEGFKASLCLNETKSSWLTTFYPYERQQRDFFRRKGREISSNAIAGGHFFHFSTLKDPCGMYYGVTPTGGPVFLDLFHKSKNRLSYNLALVGKMGVGKSTLLKKMLGERASRGDYVRIFDVSGEFTQLVEYFGGQVIYMDGSGDSIINLLQILPAENESVAYSKHITKVATVYKYLKPEVDENEILILKLILSYVYVQSKICDIKGNIAVDLKTYPADKFPVLDDLLSMTKYIIDNFDMFRDKVFSKNSTLQGVIRESMIKYVENIELSVHDLCSTYGNVFNGHTTIKSFYDEKIVCFNVSALAEMESGVYDAQLYNALTVCWDNAVMHGQKMKKLHDTKQIEWIDIERTLILMDEAHRNVNASKLAGVVEISKMMREGRKYFAGIGLASQSIRDFIPDDCDSIAVSKLKELFELTTYKFVMNHDSASIPKLREVFQSAFTDDEIERITTLEGRNCILSAGRDKLEFEVWAEPIVLELGDGGA